ncbi:EF-hand calcium-binding domain-containing protein 4A isoform X2 [Corythoichthys intestinalis]|uniref:EF-hand calcium-binding domain-containing protein 4A isoform X2 n=1 Tax=Corythoichthys intestinalis TaxID=161448 RepID=UPI0025A4D0DF|nr:EF-hand calcium-binding domain-containing protein 4A isoform X2 [Corythoichthys intestinalis]
MSQWLNDGEVLEGQGSGEAVPVSPRPQSLSLGSPRLGRGRSPLGSPIPRKAAAASPQAETIGKAKQLFVLCDKEGKGFITKRDMQRLQMELPLSPEQLETVFESLDRESNGFLTPLEFSTGLGEFMGQNDTAEQSQELDNQDSNQVDLSEDATTMRLNDILNALGADKLSDSQQELSSLWCELQRARPELLRLLESILHRAVTHLQDTFKERDTLEQALRRRESEHDQVVRSICEEMENQIREEQEKRLAQESIRQKQRGIQVEEELRMRDQALEITLSRQKELESRVQQLIFEQSNIQEQNQELRSVNVQLQEQAESCKEQLQTAMVQLAQLQLSAAQEQMARQQNMIKVSRNIQKEKDSLLRQLSLLRDMNKSLRDEKDAQLTRKRHVFKVVFLGNSGVGKSSLIQHYCTGHFYSSKGATNDFQMRTITMGSTSITLQLWDTAGQERFRSITEQYYHKANAIMVVYDITCMASFTTVREWMNSVKDKMCDGVMLVLLGNKLDLADSHCRKVSRRAGQMLAEQHEASFYECSAKTGENIEQLMTHMAEMLIAQPDRKCDNTLSLTEYVAQRSCCV